MKCYKCRAELTDTARYCSICGAEQGFSVEILERAVQGDQEAITQLYNVTYSDVYYTIHALIKDEDAVMDILQYSYICGFQHLEQLNNANSFRPWIKRIAVNTAKNWLVKKGKENNILFSQLMEEENGEVLEFKDEREDTLPDVVIDREETRRLIEEIIGTLSDKQRMVVGMFYYEEMSVREIAKILEYNENTVKSYLNYARKQIEDQVLELERKGTKLYALAPIPFMLLLFRSQRVQAEEISDKSVLRNVMSICGKKIAINPTMEHMQPSSKRKTGSRITGKAAHSSRKRKKIKTGMKVIISMVVVTATVTGVIWGYVATVKKKETSAVKILKEDTAAMKEIPIEEEESPIAEKDLTEYNSLLDEASNLENTDYVLAIEKYLEAKELYPEESEAYVDLLNLYIKEEEYVSECCLVEEANALKSKSPELKQLLAEESQKQWYVVGAHSLDYTMYEDEKSRQKPTLGELVYTPTTKRDFYYEYDEKGRLVQTNSGSYLSFRSMATGLARFPEITTFVDETYWQEKRAVSGEDYIDYKYGRGIYEVLAPIDDKTCFFTFEYNDNGSITEVQYVDAEGGGNYWSKHRNDYTFDSYNRLTSQVTYWGSGPCDVMEYYSNFNYSDNYANFSVDGETRYWEEGYSYYGILNKYMIPYINGSKVRFSVSKDDTYKKFGSHVSVPYVREVFTYSDGKDACGNITSRTVKEEILLGTGRELIQYANGGSDYGAIWVSFQSNIPIQEVYYDYVYCKPSEIKGKTEGSSTNIIKSITNLYDDVKTPEVTQGVEAKTNEDTMASVSGSDYILPKSSNTRLSDSEVETLSKSELRLARNEIFARHGYIFLSEDLKEYFGKFDWYKPTVESRDFDINRDLSEIERANIELIEKYENK